MSTHRKGARNNPPPVSLMIWLLLAASVGHSQEPSEQALRKAVQNPVGQLIQVQVMNNTNFDAGPFTRNTNTLEVEPVIPFRISQDWLLVSRILVNALVYQPDLARMTGGSVGFGDTTPTFFLTPADAAKVVWGVGPSLQMPTATTSAVGAGKWALGPSVAVFTQPKWGTVGFIVQNVWSVAGDPKGPNINQMMLQLNGQYNLGKTWYLSSTPTIGADWNLSRRNRWIVPLGGGVGRVFKIGKQSFNGTVVFYGAVVRPERLPAPKWQLSLQLAFLYPKKKHGKNQ